MKERFILFEFDFDSYHLPVIRRGMKAYLESCPYPVSFIPLGLEEFKVLNFPSSRIQLGVVGWFRTKEPRIFLEENGIPFINLYESAAASNIGCTVRFENEGKLAANFFARELGLKHLGFYGLRSVASSQRRYAEFRRAAESHRIEVQYLDQSIKDIANPIQFINRDYKSHSAQKHQWLRSLKKPCGIFCANDRLALNLFFFCKVHGFSVPDEISILGVGSVHDADNGEVQSISIVHLDHLKQGFVSARAMAEHLCGKTPVEPIRMQPDGIIHRSTTTRLAVGDPLIRDAIAIIQSDPSITVEDLCQRLHLSRRAIERRFSTVTKMTAARAIDFERFNKAKLMMQNPHYSYEAIAGLAGYTDARHMRRSFYRFAQMNPSQYRSMLLGGSGEG